MLFYEDKTFTVATGTDQYIATSATNNNMNHEQAQNPVIQPITQGKPIRYLSVCSGMEAASVAWHPLGWKPVGFSEIEPFPCAILKHRFPDVPNYGDLTKYAEWPLAVGDVDLICGGTPCQAFSVAGLRQGLADPRGNLALVFLGLVDRLRPKYVLWENVPGVLSSNRGSDFAAFVGALAELGYGFAWRCVDAQFFGVPQRRKRVYLLAVQGAGNWRTAAEILFEPEGLRGDFEASRKAGEETAFDAGSSVEAGGKKWPAKLACTLNASFGEKQGLEDQHALGGGSLFVPAPICMSSGQANAAISEDKAHTLNATHEAQTVAFTPSSFAQYAEGIGTIRAAGGDLGGGSEGLIVNPTPFRKSKRACSATDNETWVLADAANTLNNFDLGDTRTTHAVVEPTAFILDSYTSNSMKSSNPNSGCREVDMTKCLDTSCLNPACNQGGVMITQPSALHTMPGSVAPTVTSSGPPYSRTGNERVEAEALAITFQPGNLRRDAGSDPSTTTTLKASSGDQTPHVAYVSQGVDLYNQTLTGDLHVPLRTAGGHGAPAVMAFDTYNQSVSHISKTLSCAASDADHVGTVFQPTMAVRRLTPEECEKLQGFKSGWSKIPWKGKPETECPDGPRYKACGNSMAVPCMFWIGNRIAQYEAKA